MKTRTIRQQVTIKASPHAVYEAYMDQKKHAKMIGARARISRKKDGAFSVWDGWASGWTCDAKKDKMINQCWRGKDWPKDHYSDLTITLKKVRGGTRLLFVQTGVPANKLADIKTGWKEYYWKPMKLMLEA